MENKITLTADEARMIMEAVTYWSCDLSEVRHATHEQKIASVLCKLNEIRKTK